MGFIQVFWANMSWPIVKALNSLKLSDSRCSSTACCVVDISLN